jgi:hypothetical protein
MRMEWRRLSRDEQRALERLYGGGSIRSIAPTVLDRLSRFGLIVVGGRRSRLTEEGRHLLVAEADRLGEIFATSTRAA